MASLPAAICRCTCTLPPVLAAPAAARSAFSIEARKRTTQPVNDALHCPLRRCAIELGWRWQ